MAVFSDAVSFCLQYLTFTNLIMLILSWVLLSLLWDLYEFRGMPPGPRFTCLPIIGNLLSFDRGEDMREMTNSLRRVHGRVLSLRVGSWKMVLAGSPEAIKEVLVKKSADYAGRPPFHSFLEGTLGGKDIIISNYGASWRLHRKLFTTSLRRYLADVPLLESRVFKEVHKLIQSMENQRGKPFNPSDLITKSVANVISGITFGKYFSSSHPEFNKYLGTMSKLVQDAEINSKLFILDLFTWSKYLPFTVYRKVGQMNDHLFTVTQKVLDERKASYDRSDRVEDLMTALLKARTEAEYENEEERQVLLTDDYLKNTILDMFVAGYETTSTTLKWAILYLVNYPKHQEEIHKELDEIVGRDREPCLGDRSNLPFIQAAIMETLRLANVVDFALPHYTLVDTTLCGYRIPKDTVVFADLESLHLDPNCWKNPMEFDPRRHLDSKGQLVTNQGNWLPFSAGRRVCAGEPLAKVEAFLFLASMLQKFRFEPEVGQRPPRIVSVKGVTKSPKPYKIRALKRV